MANKPEPQPDTITKYCPKADLGNSMNKEIEMFSHYAQDSIDYYNPNDKEMCTKVAKNLHNLIGFEKPDMILPLSNQVMIIEHFQFDASRYKKGKGNLDKILLSERDRKFDALKEKNDTENLIRDTTEIGCKYTAEYYISNLKRVFDEHLGKIATYKQRLIEHGFAKNEKSILTAFLIIDTTPLGSYRMVDGIPKSFTLFQLKKFNEMLGDAHSLDYVFNGFFNGEKNKVSFMSNTPESRNIFKKEYIDFDEDEYFSFKPKEMRWQKPSKKRDT